MSQYTYLSTPSPEIAAAIASIPPRPLVSDINLRRKAFDEFAVPILQKGQVQLLPPESDYKVEDHVVPVDGGEIKVRALIPTSKGEDTTFPLFVWFHGGGWALGNIEMDDYYLRSICVDLQIVVLNIDYRLSPEFPFPTGLNDAFAALKWVSTNPTQISPFLDLQKGFVIGGSSAGGNFAAALSIMARDDPYFDGNEGRKISGALLQVPMVCHPDFYPDKYKDELLSMEQNQDAPLNTRDDIYEFIKHLNPQPPSNPLFSPLLSPSHSGLSATYIQVSGLDPLRDEGLVYEKVLKESGVPTRLDVYQGLPHGGHVFFPTLDVSKKFDKDFRDGLRWLLGWHVSVSKE